MNTLLLATRNPGKVGEMSGLLSDLGIQIQSLLDFTGIPDIVEDGKTFEENARKKAQEAFKHIHLPTLADDSGLEVPYLNGQPGVYSARYAGENATYDDNNKKLLRALMGTMPDQRRARFRSVVVFLAPGTRLSGRRLPTGLSRPDNVDDSLSGQVEKIAEGTCSGTIAEEPRGKEGFGYDPIFVPDGFLQTFAELPPDVKNRISHRAIALQTIKKFLNDYFRKSFF